LSEVIQILKRWFKSAGVQKESSKIILQADSIKIDVPSAANV